MGISFEKLLFVLKSKGLKQVSLAKAIGVYTCYLTNIRNGILVPNTQKVAEICCFLKCKPSDIMEFTGYELNPYFSKEPLYEPPENPEKLVTYAPFWGFVEGYEMSHPDFSVNDLFDKIEPPKKMSEESKSGIAKSIKERYGMDVGFKEKKGISHVLRSKIRNDVSISMATVYNICSVLGCSPDWVFSYK